MEKILIDESYATVTYVGELELGKIIWHRTPNAQEYKRSFEVMIDEAKAGVPITKFLSDIRKQGIINPELRKWFEKDMMPLAIKEGLLCGAVVFDGNAFKKYYMNMIIAASGKFGLPIKLFNQEAAAVEWLNAVVPKMQQAQQSA